MNAFDEIYKLYVSDVYRFLLCMTGDQHIAEELTQETFYRAYKNIGRFKGTCKMSVWLCQIAKNLSYSHFNKEKAKFKKELDESIPSTVDVEEKFLQSQSSLSLHQILHTLNEPYKEVFTLKVFGELSYQQISQIFGKSESWARVTYYRAKVKIQTIFNEKEGYDENKLPDY